MEELPEKRTHIIFLLQLFCDVKVFKQPFLGGSDCIQPCASLVQTTLKFYSYLEIVLSMLQQIYIKQ